MPPLIIKVEVLTWCREDGPNHTSLNKGTLEYVLLLVGYTHRHVPEADTLHRDVLTAMDPNWDTDSLAVNPAKGYVLKEGNSLGIEAFIRVLVVVGLNHNANTNIIKGYIVVGYVANVASSPRGSLYSNAPP